MNENYIPKEEDTILTEAAAEELPVPVTIEEEPIPETIPEDTAPEDEFQVEETEAEELLPEEAVFEELSPAEPASDASEEAVTEIILDTLAEQELETAADPDEILTESEEEQILDELTQEFSPEAAELPTGEVPAEEVRAEDGSGEEATAPVVDIPRKERPARKGRPRRKKGDGLLSIPHLLAAAIWLLIIVAVGTSLGRMIWVCAADVLAFGRENKEVTISVTADDTMETIADKLHDAGLINLPDLFLLYADLTDVAEEHKITTGTFTLNTMYDYMALVNHMGPRATNRAVVEDVLIPEGFSCRQIFALLEEKGVCKAADLEAYAASGELKDYWFLEGVERGSKYCLEGFLFPDTYDFYENSTPKLALEKMLDGFQYRFTEELYAKLPALNERLTEMMKKNGENETYIAEHQLTLRDLLTVASMIEEETASNAESYRIASVIYNRLFSWGSTPRYLNIDASIIYALDGKTNLTAEDMAVDSPYNTYTHTGLTPGPISNPGLSSIQAALEFEDTSYYYYVLNPATGEHQFSKTYAEHTEWVEKFREAKNNG